MASLICGLCKKATEYIVEQDGETFALCTRHSRETWKRISPLRNPAIGSWLQTRIFSGTVH